MTITTAHLFRAANIAAQIVTELSNIKDSYTRQRFLEEIKDQTFYCWHCGNELPYTGICCCLCDD